MLELRIGDVVNMTSCTAKADTISATFKAPKGEQFVFVLVGVKKANEPFDAEAALKALGWTFEGKKP